MKSQKEEIIDSHCHLDDKAFDADRSAAWKRAQAAGIVSIINPASSLDDSRAVVTLAHEVSGVFAAVGIHPQVATELSQADLNNATKVLDELCQDPAVVAVGEFGLDTKNGSAEEQAPTVRALLKLAQKNELPIIPATAERITGIFEQTSGTLVEQRAEPLHPGSAVTRPDNLFAKIETAK